MSSKNNIKMAQKIQSIPEWVPAITAPLIAVIKAEFVAKVDDMDIRMAISEALDTVQATAVVLADDNPADKDQLEAIWLAFVNASIAGLVDSKVQKAINKIPNETIRVPLDTLRVPIVNMLRLITDENPDNAFQLEAQWLAFIKDPKVQEIFLGIVDRLIEVNLEGATKIIAATLWATLKQIIKDQISELRK